MLCQLIIAIAIITSLPLWPWQNLQVLISLIIIVIAVNSISQFTSNSPLINHPGHYSFLIIIFAKVNFTNQFLNNAWTLNIEHWPISYWQSTAKPVFSKPEQKSPNCWGLDLIVFFCQFYERPLSYEGGGTTVDVLPTCKDPVHVRSPLGPCLLTPWRAPLPCLAPWGTPARLRAFSAGTASPPVCAWHLLKI